MHRATPIHSSRKREAATKAVVVLDPHERQQQQQQEHSDLDELTQRLNSWQYDTTPKAPAETVVDRASATTTDADAEKRRKLGKSLLLRKQDSVKTMDEVNRILGTLIAHQPTMRQRSQNGSAGKLDAAAHISALEICSTDWSWDSKSSSDVGDCTIVTIEGYCLPEDEDDTFSAFTLHASESVASSCNSSVTWHGDQQRQNSQPGDFLDDFLDWEMP